MDKKILSPTDKLFKAIWNRSLKGVQAAVAEGADVNTMNTNWETPLYLCSEFNHSRIARFLLSIPGIDILKGRLSQWPQGIAGICIPLTNELHNRTPLYAAIIARNTSIARMILAHPDKDKYLGDTENWQSIIKGTFNYSFSPDALAVLLEAAKPYPKLFQFTIDKAKSFAKSFNMKTPKIDIFIEKVQNWRRLSRDEKLNFSMRDF